MATKVVMEALSPTMEEGRLVEWKKAEGDPVATGDVLAEVETDKAVMELVARGEGVLLKQVAAAGATVPVAEVVGWIGKEGEEIPGGGAAKPASKAPQQKDAKKPADDEQPADAAEATPADEPASDDTRDTDDQGSPAGQQTQAAGKGDKPARPRAEGERMRASPVARRIAEERGLDLNQVSGSGPEGRIIKRDLDDLRPAASGGGGVSASSYTDVPLSQMRKAIAKRLVQSIGPIPTFYLTAEVDMERASEARDALLAREPEGKFSFNDIIIRATAEALTRHPWVNAWWMDDKVRQWQEVHVGVAVAIEDGLITPIVRNANRKTLREISAEVRELAGRARNKKLQPDEYTGATFTVSNLGMFGIDDFTAIINPPEAGILAVGRIEPRAVVVDGQVVIRRRMRITMSCDHRVIDGATGAEFLKTLVGMLENPLALVW